MTTHTMLVHLFWLVAPIPVSACLALLLYAALLFKARTAALFLLILILLWAVTLLRHLHYL